MDSEFGEVLGKIMLVLAFVVATVVGVIGSIYVIAKGVEIGLTKSAAYCEMVTHK